jgi:SAM-dependent methyltransferase
VAGCGISDDPVFLAGLGCEVTAFDVSPTAVAEARRRFAGSPVTFAVADLLAPPAAWAGAFDLVAELYTVPALYGQAREAAIGTLPGLVAPGGTLLVIARAADEENTDEENPARDPAMMPWPLTRGELEAMAGSQLTAHSARSPSTARTRPGSAGEPSSAAARRAAAGRNRRIPRFSHLPGKRAIRRR